MRPPYLPSVTCNLHTSDPQHRDRRETLSVYSAVAVSIPEPEKLAGFPDLHEVQYSSHGAGGGATSRCRVGSSTILHAQSHNVASRRHHVPMQGQFIGERGNKNVLHNRLSSSRADAGTLRDCEAGRDLWRMKARCRANMACVRQSRPDSGLGFQVKVSKPLKVLSCRSEAKWRELLE